MRCNQHDQEEAGGLTQIWYGVDFLKVSNVERWWYGVIRAAVYSWLYLLCGRVSQLQQVCLSCMRCQHVGIQREVG